MAKEPQELKWIENLLPEEGYRRKPMFGGFAYYIDDKLVLVIFESPGSRSYRSQTFDYELWNGCMFPVEHEYHEQALQHFPFLISHPILPKWFYLPLETEAFDDLATEIIAQVVKPHSFWGSIPKSKSKKAKVSKKTTAENISLKMDTRKPRMFSDEPAEEKLQSAVKISDLKNLGAVAELQFHKAKIMTVQKFIQLGWKKTLTKLVEVNPKNRHSIFAYALIGALANKEWNRISEDEKLEARQHIKSLAPKKEPKKNLKKVLKKASKKASPKISKKPKKK